MCAGLHAHSEPDQDAAASPKRHFGVYAFDRLQSAPPAVLAPACGCCGAAPHATPRLVSFNFPGRGDEITILILQTGGTRGWSGAARKRDIDLCDIVYHRGMGAIPFESLEAPLACYHCGLAGVLGLDVKDGLALSLT